MDEFAPNLPDTGQCLKLISDMEMMPHIIDHSRIVTRVAQLMYNHLSPSNPGLNPDLIHAAAMLHDITKTRSFQTGERHAESGSQLMHELGYPEVGEVIRQHILLDKYVDHGDITEAEIVNYADKRVLHDAVVPLTRRLGYIQERYGTTQELRTRISIMSASTIALERRLFTGLPITPDQIAQLVGTRI
ncbi:MAG: HD domain-containing protein [Pseudomonadota bacterium]